MQHHETGENLDMVNKDELPEPNIDITCHDLPGEKVRVVISSRMYWFFPAPLVFDVSVELLRDWFKKAMRKKATTETKDG